MQLRFLFPFLLALVASGGLRAAPAASPGESFSPAEQRVFGDPHLDNLPATATLRYQYRKNEAGQAAVDDEVVLTAHRDPQRGHVVQLDYLHGERHLELPAVEQASSNPLLLYFLEADVRSMRRRLGGQENYFRRRIRLALAEAAQVSSVPVTYAGKAVPGTLVVIQPYVGDKLQERFKGMAGKSYRFTLSPHVPGGVVELRTVVDNPKGGSTPLIEEVLTLREGKPGEIAAHGPRWPQTMTEGKSQP